MLINYKTGKPLTNKQIRDYVISRRQAQGYVNYDAQAYRRELDVLRKRRKNYERGSGAAVKLAPRELLYTIERAKAAQGADYVPSAQTAGIYSTTSQNTGKTLTDPQVELAFDRITVDFGQLIDAAHRAREAGDERAMQVYSAVYRAEWLREAGQITPKEYRALLEDAAKAVKSFKQLDKAEHADIPGYEPGSP